MRVLVIGAGALGGYFGACLVRANRDVTFLVRPRRAEQLARDGLRVISPNGDFTVPVRTVLAGDLHEPFDLVLIGTKSYSLMEATDQFAPAVGPTTAILPILNGLAHLDTLSLRFGAERVLGGMVLLSATLDPDGRVIHFSGSNLTFGEIAGGFGERVRALSALFAVSGLNAKASDAIMQEMWEKWTGLATGAGMTCMMRGCLADIVAAPGGRDAILRLFDECRAIATASGFAPRPTYLEWATNFYPTASLFKTSMLRDIERGFPTEGEHILGDLAARARALGIATPTLDLAYIHVAAYEAGRRREAAAA